MKKKPIIPSKATDLNSLDAEQLRALVLNYQAENQQQKDFIKEQFQQLEQQEKENKRKQKLLANALKEADSIIEKLAEANRLLTVQKFCSKSEKSVIQYTLFDEAELEALLAELFDVMPEQDDSAELTEQRQARTTRQRGFSASLLRERVEHCLSDAEKVGAVSTFFTKVKEELHYIPAQLKVLEHWQEKAVFKNEREEESFISASRPEHPFGKCTASTGLIAHVITDKYLYAMPLYRQEDKFKRLGHELNRTVMAQWCIRFGDLVLPLLKLLRDHQNSSHYLQADETRIKVLKDGKVATSDKWMWVTHGGPPGQPSTLFEYDLTRAGSVAARLLDGFTGVLQADGYSGYGQICKDNNLMRIGCWDHARRKFDEAKKAADATTKKGQNKTGKADLALSYIRKLYRVEAQIKDRTAEEKYQTRQAISLPALEEFKIWLDDNTTKILKGSKLKTAIDYTLNQWEYLIGYCQRGDLKISNEAAENAIRPFAIGRKNWLFSDTKKGAQASAACYSLIETAKANNLDPQAYIQHILDNLSSMQTVEQLETLLPWNVQLRH